VGSHIAWVTGNDDIRLIIGTTIADFDFDIGNVNPPPIGPNLWVEGTIEVEGDIVVGDGAPSHCDDSVGDIFLAEFLQRFPSSLPCPKLNLPANF
jgi:hypothetical protein